VVAPVTANDDLLVAAYPNANGQFVAVGTRETLTGDFALRVRYFSDTLELDTDFANEGQPDSTPNPFVLQGYGATGPGEQSISYPVAITGINVPTAISIEGGSYSVSSSQSCGEWTGAAGTVTNGQYVCVQIFNPMTPSTTTTATLTIGGVQASFSATTGDIPNTYIYQGPADPMSPGATATFGYSGGAWFECSLDGAPFAACPYSSVSYPGIAEGTHTFQVRAQNEWGVDPTPASRTWAVLGRPDTTIDSHPGLGSNTGNVTFTFTSNPPGPLFECSLDAGGYAPCTSPKSYSGLQQGSHTFRVRAVNAAGPDLTPAQHSFVVDYFEPQTTITNVVPYTSMVYPSPSTTITFTFTSNESPPAFECSLDFAAFVACASPRTYSSVPDGPHSFRVRAVDLAGNADSSPDYWSWSVDATLPQTTITSGPSGTVASTAAQFNFSSNESMASFQCRLDGAAFATCYPTVSLQNLANGTHTFEVRAVDQAGNADDTPAVRTWTVLVDSVAPETTITSHPPATTQSSDASLAYAANESNVTFECRLDGAAWGNCTSPATRQYHDLAAGSHTFEVRAADAAGNVDATPASATWVVDPAYGPDTAITSGPSGTVASSSATIAFTSPSGTPAVAFQCAFAGALFPCTSPWTVTGLAEGEHGFSVSAIDAEGNSDRTPASLSWTVDTSAPDTSVTSGPSGTTAVNSATFQFTSTDPAATFKCSLDGAAFVSCSSPANYGGLAEGMHMFEVRALDGAGNADQSPASRTWSVDTAAPNTTIGSGPAAVTSQTTATFAFSATEGGQFQCKLDAGSYGPCVSPVTYAALAAGSHSFSVYATDGVGNADPSPATWAWAIDVVAPDTSLSGGPTGTVTQTTATFSFSSPDSGATFECRLDGAAFAACTSPLSLSGLSSASHTFNVRAKDAGGNVDASPASRTWTVDATAPDTTITASPAAIANATSATFSFTATESATFECKLDAGSFAACTSAKSYSGLAQGSHTFQVRAKDALGNTDASPAAWTWTVDTVAPNTTIASGPSGTVTATTATFTFTSTEAGTFECKLDTGAYAACTSPKTYTGLTKANHTFTVRAKDAAGNTDASPATRTWRVN
jgi:hypothetical protein